MHSEQCKKVQKNEKKWVNNLVVPQNGSINKYDTSRKKQALIRYIDGKIGSASLPLSYLALR